MRLHRLRGRAAARPLPSLDPVAGSQRRPGRALAATVAAAAASAARVVAWPAAGARANEDPRDQPYATAVVNQALETERSNVEIPWSNPETGHGGTVVIERTYYRDGGTTPCRDYVRTLERPGSSPVVTEGTGCRIGAGRWQLEERTARAAVAAEPEPRRPARPAPTAVPEPRETRSVEREAASAPACPEPAASAEAAPPPTAIVALPSAAKPPAFPPFSMPSKAEL